MNEELINKVLNSGYQPSLEEWHYEISVNHFKGIAKRYGKEEAIDELVGSDYDYEA
ncbi:hypothetical protein [Oenococcus sicerae]|uniref:hypothetical protein n=1 Tax=Oenococcus sicerae TaxID=2203724 RepID=UPI0039E81240